MIDTMADQQEDLWGVPPQSISWDVEPPMRVEGIVLSQQKAQRLNYDTKKPETWDDGRPKLKVIVELQTEEEDGEGDDGKRQLHVNIPSALFAAIRTAIQSVPGRRMFDGDRLAVEYTHDAEQTPAEKRAKRNPAKQFTAEVTPRSEFAAR